MLQKMPNVYQLLAAERAPGSDREPWWPPDNPNTLKSRARRERLRQIDHRRDPVTFHNTPLRRSAFNRLVAAFERTIPKEQRDLAMGERNWSGKMLQTILETWEIKPPKC